MIVTIRGMALIHTSPASENLHSVIQKCHRFPMQHVMILCLFLPSRFGIYVILHNFARLHDCGYWVPAMLSWNKLCQSPIWVHKMLKNNAMYSLCQRWLFLTYCLIFLYSSDVQLHVPSAREWQNLALQRPHRGHGKQAYGFSRTERFA